MRRPFQSSAFINAVPIQPRGDRGRVHYVDPTGPYVTAKAWPDEDRCRFIMLAIAYNFPQDQWETQFQEFPEAYENGLIEEPSNQVASVDNIRELIRKRPLRGWPAKEELYNWPAKRPS